jgi:hypothetical protein
MIVPLLSAALVLLMVSAAFSAWSSWRWRTGLLARFRAEWSHPRECPRDMDGVADFFRTRTLGAVLDDRTWNDLLLDDVFAHLDRTESRIGQQMLYDRLRSAPAPRSLDAFDALCVLMAEHPDRRERAQAVLARLGSPASYFLHRLGRPDALNRQPWHVIFPLWSPIVPLILSLGYFWPKLLLVAACGYVVNLIVHIANGRRIDREIAAFRQVGPLLSAAPELQAIGTEETAAITGTITRDLMALQRLGVIARWVSRDPTTADQFSVALLEMLNVLCLIDASALYFAHRVLPTCAPPLLRLIEAVGEIDAAIAIASFRAGVDSWTRPGFAAPDASATFTDLRHPLLDRAVSNSIALAPPHGVLVTGSNMSGKSTFLRTLGINVVLAQTTNTSLCGTCTTAPASSSCARDSCRCHVRVCTDSRPLRHRP